MPVETLARLAEEVAVIRAAADRGDIEPGDTVVEYTAGTTGVSLAFVCAALGFRLHAVFSDAFSEEKRRTMLPSGAQITDVASDRGRITETLIKAMIDRASTLSSEPNHGGATRSTTTTPSAATTLAVDSGLRYLTTPLYAPPA